MDAVYAEGQEQGDDTHGNPAMPAEGLNATDWAAAMEEPFKKTTLRKNRQE